MHNQRRRKNGTWQRLARFWGPKSNCNCGEGISCRSGCSPDCRRLCAAGEWTDEGPVKQPEGLTLSSLSVGERAKIEELYLPSALKKRLLSLGMTGDTEISVISKEGGRMILIVRDSRLGISPEMAGRITCKPVR